MNQVISPIRNKYLPLGTSLTPPKSPWGINFGGGLDSTTVILECISRGFRPDWILFADTGSDMPETYKHVEFMNEYIKSKAPDWPEIITVRWIRKDGSFEPLHELNLRTKYLPSKAYGYAGCTSKYKIQPMDSWRRDNGFQQGSFAVGYNASESKRIVTACRRGDAPNFTAWYPLLAWNIRREDCERVVKEAGMRVGKSSCFMCPNMKRHEFLALREHHRELFDVALKIEDTATEAGNGHRGLLTGGLANIDNIKAELLDRENEALEDRCHHGSCFT